MDLHSLQRGRSGVPGMGGLLYCRVQPQTGAGSIQRVSSGCWSSTSSTTRLACALQVMVPPLPGAIAAPGWFPQARTANTGPASCLDSLSGGLRRPGGMTRVGYAGRRSFAGLGSYLPCAARNTLSLTSLSHSGGVGMLDLYSLSASGTFTSTTPLPYPATE